MGLKDYIITILTARYEKNQINALVTIILHFYGF
ncbi:hypothetical protein Metho_1062 [Methanomethylovorans hollandica DSM 15978]|uniref:Uncharacterized protein n=1 Tax=Methanomethylovorans hollandica (strain DSM 15978 / NBRC 107637 / DMS1) TaxID=867904 RepID=L0KZ07_METHD|nr:hypothetical protein Metho_1062 [Methanomethylovorans hollandica DSM 15978]